MYTLSSAAKLMGGGGGGGWVGYGLKFVHSQMSSAPPPPTIGGCRAQKEPRHGGLSTYETLAEIQ